MGLCSVCVATLHVQRLSSSPGLLNVSARAELDHHPTLQSFEDAVREACYLCSWLNKEHGILAGSTNIPQCQPFTVVRVNARLNVFSQELSFSIGLNSMSGVQWALRGPHSTFDLLQLVTMGMSINPAQRGP